MTATAWQLSTVFARNSTLDSPEKKLLFAVLRQAVYDLKKGNRDQKCNARRFMAEDGLDLLCGWIDLSAEWVRKELRTHAA